MAAAWLNLPITVSSCPPTAFIGYRKSMRRWFTSRGTSSTSPSEKKMLSELLEANGEAPSWTASCPMPISDHKEIVLAHGSGGKLSHRLIERMILPAFRNPLLQPLHDGAVFSVGEAKLAFSTDSYVVKPIFFPGGDIGKLAVHGTINDLAMAGARPLYLSAGFILEEGFPIADLRRIVASMAAAATEAGVAIVTGDTKVVQRGKADGLFINTAGVGVLRATWPLGQTQLQPGDKVLLNGPIGDHGIAIMLAREALDIETDVESDTAPLHSLVAALFAAAGDG